MEVIILSVILGEILLISKII